MKKLTVKLASALTGILSMALFFSANTASSGMIFEPKAPKELDTFRKMK